MQVRRELSAVPDALFRAGRARVLERFLQRDKIFLTNWFMRYEQQARENITREMSSLNLFE
ncbi:MAG TPA: hypothetical protein VFZ78_11190 [Flavisolibacter sp.]